MICKYCGEDISCHIVRKLFYDKKRVIDYYEEQGNSEFAEIIKNYDDIKYVCSCGKCEHLIDYIDLPPDIFVEQIVNQRNSDRKSIGKAIIRYYQLDELLTGKTD